MSTESIAILIILVGAICMFAITVQFRSASDDRTWMEQLRPIARMTGLHLVKTEGDCYTGLDGVHCGTPTKIGVLNSEGYEGVLPSILGHITMRLNVQLNRSLTLERKYFLGGNQIRIGDPSFEGIYLISGQPERFAAQALDSKMLRRKLGEANFHKLTIQGEKVTMVVQGFEKKAHEIPYFLHVLRLVVNSVERAVLSSNTPE
jgi:hypothetical protein